MRTTTSFVAGCVVGAAAEYLWDPNHGARRRHEARDRALARARHRSRDAVRRARYMEGVAEGVAHRAAKVVHPVPAEEPDDVTLSRKVESIAFRAAGTPKGRVSVNAESGVVYLRGQLDSVAQIESLVSAASAVDGVKRVENRLHTQS